MNIEKENEIMKKALEDIAIFGKINSGCGYSCAVKAEKALKEIDEA